MKIAKTQPPATLPAAERIQWRDAVVQGATTGTADGALCVRSPRRFKRFCRGAETVFFCAGDGHFKWARGETPFREGDCFLIDGEGEYEINGSCEFFVLAPPTR